MIYVDDLMIWGPEFYRDRQAARVGAKHGHRWCHLFADKADCPELHALAAQIGMKRAWFQGDHYDLVPPKRAQAVTLGAIEVDRSQAVAIWRTQPSARRWKCRLCGFVTERMIKPPATCPKCDNRPA